MRWTELTNFDQRWVVAQSGEAGVYHARNRQFRIHVCYRLFASAFSWRPDPFINLLTS